MNSPPLEPAVSLPIGVVRKIELARGFLGLAQQAIRSSSDFNLHVAVHHLQDATEIFLFAVAEHLGTSLREKGGFDGYIEQINAATSKELPFRARLNALNKTRVNSKHYSVQPERKEVSGFITVVTEFFDEVSRNLLGVEFNAISTVHLIAKANVRQPLLNAVHAFLAHDYENSLIETRKAFYHEFEARFDISEFKEQKKRGPLAGWFCWAPAFVQNADYIKRNVSQPTDFIVFDHSRMDAELSKAGLSHTTFWNVWRLTPEVFFDEKNGEWIVKHDRRVFDAEGIRERAEYTLHATIELCLSAQRNREATLSPSAGFWSITLRKLEVALYSKADAKSASQPIPPEITELSASSWIKGFDGRIYWNVIHTKPYLSGFVCDDDVLHE